LLQATLLTKSAEDKLQLPQPFKKGEFSLEEVLAKRRSVRSFSPRPLSLKQLSQILWAAQGVTGEGDFGRTSPSAGALYPLEIFVVVKRVEGIEAGVYQYDPFRHTLELVTKGDYIQDLVEACLSQFFISQAPVVFVIAADYDRVTWKYGERGVRYVYIEAGHCAQNLCLQAVALNLASVPVGAFWDRQVKEVIFLPDDLDPIYVIPVGYPGKGG